MAYKESIPLEFACVSPMKMSVNLPSESVSRCRGGMARERNPREVRESEPSLSFFFGSFFFLYSAVDNFFKEGQKTPF